ncbi:hypothetical protein VNO77_23446 [Canavalia gladiata]|uniref:Uncharacterized protein n=1 Tax=Canavalia gladiata TaxID=3824 RepID=A0AAN9L5T6_CANGL
MLAPREDLHDDLEPGAAMTLLPGNDESRGDHATLGRMHQVAPFVLHGVLRYMQGVSSIESSPCKVAPMPGKEVDVKKPMQKPKKKVPYKNYKGGQAQIVESVACNSFVCGSNPAQRFGGFSTFYSYVQFSLNYKTTLQNSKIAPKASIIPK